MIFNPKLKDLGKRNLNCVISTSHITTQPIPLGFRGSVLRNILFVNRLNRRVGDRSKRKEKGGETRSSINLLPSQVSIFRDEDMKRREEKRREEKRREQNKTEEQRREEKRREEKRTEQNRTEQNITDNKRGMRAFNQLNPLYCDGMDGIGWKYSV